jgi:hypothetical protein
MPLVPGKRANGRRGHLGRQDTRLSRLNASLLRRVAAGEGCERGTEGDDRYVLCWSVGSLGIPTGRGRPCLGRDRSWWRRETGMVPFARASDPTMACGTGGSSPSGDSRGWQGRTGTRNGRMESRRCGTATSTALCAQLNDARTVPWARLFHPKRRSHALELQIGFWTAESSIIRAQAAARGPLGAALALERDIESRGQGAA